ncbi:MAG TPA: hypothetical protein VK502_03040 [Candidatus Saccharimonadales bacterium]|nr:hypothetical protein [Candidatus Saccharimonadales bacterium]
MSVIPQEHMKALERACEMARSGERDVNILVEEGDIRIDVDSEGFVEVVLISQEMKELFDTFRAACTVRAKTRSVGAGVPVFSPWSITFIPA